MVGPESARAHPGPVCYRKGGPLAVTDANVALGRVQPAYFPRIFGVTEDQPLDAPASIAAFELLGREVNAWQVRRIPVVVVILYVARDVVSVRADTWLGEASMPAS